MAEYNRFDVEHVNDVTVVRPVDKELSDLVLQDELHEQLMSLLEKEQPTKLLISFGTVEFCTSGPINNLIRVRNSVLARQGQFKMSDLTRHVHDEFVALNLLDTLKVVSSEADAIASFSE